MTFLPIVGVNGASAMPTDRRARARRILRAASRVAPVVAGCEFDDITQEDLQEILGDAWWWAHESSPARDGLLVAGMHSRTAAGQPRYFDGAPASSVNAVREILRIRIDVDQRWSFPLAVLHAPKDPRGAGWFAHNEMIRNSREVGAELIYADWNAHRPAVRGYYPKRTVRMEGVTGFAGSSRIGMSAAHAVDLLPEETGDDHRAVKLTVRPIQPKRKARR